jgi:hypothetical protein
MALGYGLNVVLVIACNGAQAQTEPMMQPDSISDELRRETAPLERQGFDQRGLY